mgnify:CR=1 FL=1
MDSVLLNVLANNLGEYEQKKDKNYAFHCPFCNHYKKKLEVNLENGLWNCWVCHKKGFSVTRLLRNVHASDSDISIAQANEKYLKNRDKHTKIDAPILHLPSEFEPFHKIERNFLTEKAVRYLLGRGLSQHEILQYKIGFCQTGKYANSIIIPSYDSKGVLNFFVAKNMTIGRYMNPNFSKNQIIFDMFMNWSHNIILVEGVFDAFAIKHNAIPLLGKIMSKKLKQRLVTSKAEKVYICLDGDQKEDSIRIAEFVQGLGKRAYIVKLPEDKDPSELGHEKIWQLISDTEEFNQEDLFLQKLQLKW